MQLQTGSSWCFIITFGSMTHLLVTTLQCPAPVQQLISSLAEWTVTRKCWRITSLYDTGFIRLSIPNTQNSWNCYKRGWGYEGRKAILNVSHGDWFNMLKYSKKGKACSTLCRFILSVWHIKIKWPVCNNYLGLGLPTTAPVL